MCKNRHFVMNSDIDFHVFKTVRYQTLHIFTHKNFF